MSKTDIQVLVLLLSMIAGFLAVPCANMLCETVGDIFNAVSRFIRRMFAWRKKDNDKPNNTTMYNGLGCRGALWSSFAVGLAPVICEILKSLQKREHEDRKLKGCEP